MHNKSKAVPTCRHLFASGHLCGSPAQRGKIFCYHHQRNRQRRENIRRAQSRHFAYGREAFEAEAVASLDLPAPEDPIAVQVCLSNTFLALSSGLIPTKRAALMLYNLQIIATQFGAVQKYREELEAKGAQAKAVSDPEPIAAWDLLHQEADHMFSEERYERELVTDEPAESVAVAHAAAEQAQAERDAAFDAHPLGNLPLRDVAPIESKELEEVAGRMTDWDWERYLVQHLEISTPEREELKKKVFSDSKDERHATRMMLLKYNPFVVRSLQRRHEKMKPKYEALEKFHELPEDTKATG
jgi:hypothetical protein